MSSPKGWAIVAGVGSGTGSSIARRFAQNYAVALLARNPANYEPIVKEINAAGGKAIGMKADTTDVASVTNAINEMKESMGDAPLAAAIYNVGGGMVRKPFTELSETEIETGWNSNGRGAFLFSQRVIPLLQAHAKSKPELPPTLIFTGATAAMKGSAKLASFASGKFAMRAIAQSLAREYGPEGVHVVHAIIDGLIDIERSKGIDLGREEAKISPEAIANTYWFLHTQPRTCFTNELDLRPAVEKW